MGRLPAECLPGLGTGRGLVGREDRAEWAVGLLWHRLDWQAEPPADDRSDVTHRVALVGHRVPGGPGRRQLQGQPEEDCRVERVHGRPAPGAVARVAGHSGFTEQGYDATTVAQIAERAGVTKSTFFRHFPDKRELLVAGQETLSRLLAEGIAEAPVSASPLGAVAAGLERASSVMGPMNRELGPA